MVLEAKNTLGDFVLGSELSGREGFALEDREVDLDLVEPAGVLGQMYEVRLGNRLWSRSAARWPRWIVPLSTTQKTRLAER